MDVESSGKNVGFAADTEGSVKGEVSARTYERQSSSDRNHASHHGHAVFSTMRSSFDRKRIQAENTSLVFFPWNRYYKTWWGFTVVAAAFTVFLETFQIGFMPGGLKPYADASSILEYILVAIFVIDIAVNFNLAFYDENDNIISERKVIVLDYFKFMFWVDLMGVFPFYLVALAISGTLGEDTSFTQYLALLRLVKLVRLHRMKQLFDILQYSTKISLMYLTLFRNFGAALVWTHFAACVFYFISRQDSFDEDTTWIGGSYAGLNGFERYITTLYWSVVTFTTVGYGDFSPVSSAEQVFGMVYMLLNIILQSWIIGSITLLIVKNDEKTGIYQDTLKNLDQYAAAHRFEKPFHKRLKTQVKLSFNSSEISDESVLQHLPASLRRKVLRKLYLSSLINTSLMKDVRQQFIDSFLTACTVEIFTPGEDILQRGSISSDLYLLVGGTVQYVQSDHGLTEENNDDRAYTSTVADSEYRSRNVMLSREMKAGEFINEVSFFTESPQIDSVRTTTICKTLTMTRSVYKSLIEDHPGSAGLILHNLLAKIRSTKPDPVANLPKQLNVLNAGSIYEKDDSSHAGFVQQTVDSVQQESALEKVENLVKMHINKQKDDSTTRFLFAASRNDTGTIALMCDQGFSPNCADYDSRTALMVASMKGNADAVRSILEYEADPNLVDMHGVSALYEAAKNGHEDVMEILRAHGARLSMDESLAASTLCQCVYQGDMLTLRRLLQAGIQVDAADYDGRTAAHIASCEGNLLALKTLVEYGASLNPKDRWGNTAHDEARKLNSSKLNDYLKKL